jgi:hypothetical protein
LNERVRHHRTDDDGAGQLAGGAGEWPLPAFGPPADGGPDDGTPADAGPDTGDPDTGDPDNGDLAPGELWDAGGPGSAAAAARGCRCPMLPNDPRAGLGLLIAPDCPVHRSRLD